MTMLAIVGFLVVSLTSISAVPASHAVPSASNRIVGGSLATISEYPFAAALLFSKNLVSFSQSCGGTLITTKAILSAAQCSFSNSIYQWCARLGSSYANSGGIVYTFSAIIIHYNFDYFTLDNDIAILITTYPVSLVSGAVHLASIAGMNYNLEDNQAVWAIGWGRTSVNGAVSEQLRHVQIWSINQATCRSRYNELGWKVTDNMLCSSWLDLGGRDQCQGDSGGPLIHNGIIVGISSWAWGKKCAQPQFPGIYTRVSKFSAWIGANAI